MWTRSSAANLAAATIAFGLLASPAAAAGARVVPSLQEISLEMSRTVEVNDQSEHFTALGRPLTVADGRGGWLTAVVGGRYPSADGYGQLVFFWHNTRFLGWDARYESMSVDRLRSPHANAISALFPRYAVDDPACCPSLKPLWVTYAWTGHTFAASHRAPGGLGAPILVKLLP